MASQNNSHSRLQNPTPTSEKPVLANDIESTLVDFEIPEDDLADSPISQKKSSDFLEQTLVDIDLDEEPHETKAPPKDPLQDTVMIKVPTFEDRTDLHVLKDLHPNESSPSDPFDQTRQIRLDELDDEEKVAFQEAGEATSFIPMEDLEFEEGPLGEHSPEISSDTHHPANPPQLASSKATRQTPSPQTSANLRSPSQALLVFSEWLLGLGLLGMMVKMLLEAIAKRSPTGGVLMSVVSSAVVLHLLMVIKKKRPLWAVEVTFSVFVLVMVQSIYKQDPAFLFSKQSLTLLDLPFGEWVGFFFLGVAAINIVGVVFLSRLKGVLKALWVIGCIYSVLSFLELAFFKSEITLTAILETVHLGRQGLFRWVPTVYALPLFFGFFGFYPILALSAFILSVKQMFCRAHFRLAVLAFVIALMTTLLGHVFLNRLGLPSFLIFFKAP